MSTVLVTGATGFVGRRVLARLTADGHTVRIAVRERRDDTPDNAIVVGAVGPHTDWELALAGVDTVVHLAGQLPARGVPDEAFVETNDRGTGRLVDQALASDAKLLVLISTVAVYGVHASDTPVDDSVPPAPATAYGRTKLAAETHGARFAAAGRAAIAIRPTIVYGAEASGNWRLLQQLARSPFLLPFGVVNNRRSLVSVDNLADALARVVMIVPDPSVSGAYCIADVETPGTREIVTILREAMGKSPGLVPVPRGILAAALKAAGRETLADSLLGDLVVDASRLRQTFGWAPPERSQDAIAKSGAAFAAGKASGGWRT